jgi:hypothetical protein
MGGAKRWHGVLLTVEHTCHSRRALREGHRAIVASVGISAIDPNPTAASLAQRLADRRHRARRGTVAIAAAWRVIMGISRNAAHGYIEAERLARVESDRQRRTYFRYCSSPTCSIQSTTLPFSASWIAICVIAVVGVAPCQCFSFGENHPPESRHDDQGLTKRVVRMPSAPGTRFERHARSRTSAGSGASNSGSMRTVPVKYSAGPFPEGCEPPRLMSMGSLHTRRSVIDVGSAGVVVEASAIGFHMRPLARYNASDSDWREQCPSSKPRTASSTCRSR